MKTRYTVLAAACLGYGGLTVPAAAQSLADTKFSGFGTIGAVHSSEKNADYVSTVFQPDGAGHTRSTSFDPDTKLGVQVNAPFSKRFSGVVQVISQYQYDGSYRPMVEWANVKYQVTSDVSVRLGRIAVPAYLVSETRHVGYSYPWVRSPIEVYNVQPISRNDGVDATWRSSFGPAYNTLQAYWGKSKARLSSGDAKTDPSWGINDTVEIGSWTLRASYSSSKVDLNLASLDPLFGGLQQFAAGANAVPVPAFQSAGAQALALNQKYKLQDMSLKAYSVGGSYDPGDWFVMGEFYGFRGAGFLADSRSWYVSAGYRFGKLTPYVSYSTTKAKVEHEEGISTTGAAPLAAGAAALTAGINTTLDQFNATQHSTSVGARWDFMKNVALKGQYDRVNPAANSNGRFINQQPGYQQGQSANVYSVALDFVF
jgi:hypothetical protein